MANDVTINVRGRDAGAKAALTAGAQAGDQLAQSIGRAGEVARGVLAAGIIQDIGRRAQQFLGSASAAASGLEQAVGGTRAVFGEAAGSIDEWAKKSAQSAGLSEREFREASTLIGGQLKRMTGDVDLAAESSIQLVQVGADLAATYGGTTKEAVDAFAAALRGEADPAERFNLNLKITAVNAKAVELGLASSTSEVSEQAKAQALLALVMEQSADAQGQFAREADTAAVAQQKARAEWENARAVLGQALLPVLGETAGMVSTVTSAFQLLPDPVQSTTVAVAAVGAGLLVLLPRIAATKVALNEMGISAATASAKTRAAARSFGPAVAAFAAIAAAAAFLEPKLRGAETPIEDLTEDLIRFGQTGRVTGEAVDLLGRSNDEFRETLRNAEIDAKSFFDKLDEGSDFWLNSQNNTHQARKALEEYDAALVNVVKAGGDHQAILDGIADRYNLTEGELARLVDLLPGYQREVRRASERTRDGGEAAAGAAGDLALLGEQFGFAGDQAADAAGKMLDEWGAASSDFISVGGVFERVLDRKNEAEKRSAGSSGKTAAEIAEVHEDAARRVEKASQAVERAKVDEARTIEDAAERVEQAEERLADAQRASRDAQQALTDARREAAAQLAAFEGRIVDAELSEEAAVLRLNRAIEAQNKLRGDRTASGLDIAEADLAVRQAQRNLERAREDLAALRAEEAQAQRQGVEGSDLVRDALARQAEAAQAVIEAQEGVADAQRDSARAMSDAARRVADAQEAMAEASEEAAESIADAAAGAGGAMRGLAEDTTVTADEYIAELGRMVAEQEAWARNLIELSGRVPPAMLDELARLGPEGAAEVALLADMTSAELDKVIGLFGRKGRSSGRGFAENLARAGPTLARVARNQGREVADRLASEMLRSGSDVFEAARRLGLLIDRGLGGNRTIHVNVQATREFGANARQVVASGGIIGGLASGGLAGAQAGGIHGARVLVGERRAEVVELPRGSRVIPSVDQATDRNQGFAGGGSPQLVLRPDGRRVTALLVEVMREALRTDPAFRSDVRAAVR